MLGRLKSRLIHQLSSELLGLLMRDTIMFLTVQFPEMNSIEAMSERSTKSEVIIFLIQNAGILSGFAIILLITMFAGDINLG